MMKLIVLCGFVAIASAGSINPEWRIVGGSDANAGQFPYIVSLRKDMGTPSEALFQHSCGGTILDEYWILTAAHCVYQASPSSFKIVAGSHLLNGGDSYDVDKLIWHSEYGMTTYRNDIAVLKLASAIKFGPNVSVVKLPDLSIGGGENVVLSGWGTTSLPGNAPNNLQWIKLKTITNNMCVAEQGSHVYNSNICTLSQAGEGFCYGDQGGPLTDTSGAQVGIVSWGTPCAKGVPDVFTMVYFYKRWINTQIAEN